MPSYRSVSQLKQYEQCPWAYKLARVDKVWERPAAWLSHGTAVHSAVEEYEKSGRELPLEKALDVFREEYAKGINEACQLTPNFNYWFSSGRYRGLEDTERRYDVGLEMVIRYYEWAAKHPEESVWAAPDGVPAVEQEFNIDLDGVRVRGFIDQVIVVVRKDGRIEVRVRDVKTGAMPGDAFQLKTYAVAVYDQYGEEISAGDYWMGKTGKATRPYNLTTVSRQEVVDRFHAVDEGIKAERWDPKPGDHCARCPVATSCEFAI